MKVLLKIALVIWGIILAGELLFYQQFRLTSVSFFTFIFCTLAIMSTIEHVGVEIINSQTKSSTSKNDSSNEAE